MRSVRPALLVALTVSVALLGSVVLAHAHDASVHGLYSAQCPSCELARHAVGLLLAAPATAPLDPASVALPAAPEDQPTDDVPTLASPRAPPLS